MSTTDRPADRVDPDSVARAAFEVVRKGGFDQMQVRSYLQTVSREIERLRGAEQELTRRLADAEQRASEQTRTDPEHLTQLLGEETARVLNAAREAAAERVSRAEEEADRLRREATDESARTRQEADEAAIAARDGAATDARQTREQADEYARSTRTAAEDDAARIRATAEQAVSDEIDSARTRGREMVAEAQLVRDRILRDLAHRRKQMRVQVEQLRAARDRLIEAHEAVRSSLDEAEEELNLALPNARRAADDVARRLEAEPELTVGQLEEEIALARAADLPLLAPEGDDATHEDEPLTEEVPALDAALGITATDAEAAAAPADTMPEPMPARPAATPSHESPPAESAPAVADSSAEAPRSPDDDDVPDPGDEKAVDALFARIREARSDAVARAYEVFGPADEATVALALDESGADEAAGDEPEPDLFARRDAAVAANEAKLARLFKRSVTDEQNELQDAIRRRKKKAALTDLLDDPDNHTAKYAATLGDTLVEIARSGAAMFELTGTVDEAPLQPMVGRIIGDSLVAPLRAQLERGFAESTSDDDRIDRVRSAYREAKTQRADLVAHELANAAFNAGIVIAAPAGSSVRWLMDTTRGCSPDCQDNSLAGPIPAGESFPAGSAHPPAHQRCRCLVVPEHQ
jgi:cell division septum initiation protein DivIVA